MSLDHEWINESDAAVDERLGIISVKLPFTVTPGATKLATLQHALTFLPDEVKNFGLPLIKRDVKERPDCGMDVGFLMEGSFNPATAEGEEFTLDGSTADEKIEAHPEIEMLVAKYFPPGTSLKSAVNDNGEIIFPVTLNIDGEDQRNPLAGVRTFYLPGYIWTRSFVSQNFPRGLARNLGKVGNPPVGRLGQKPPDDGGPDWIMIRLQASWRGNLWKISDSWLNAGPGGSVPDVYRYKS